MKKTITLLLFFVIGIIILDYANAPTMVGLNMSNINWDFYMGTLNITSVLAIFIITFKLLNKREIAREKNKREISILLLENCYKECHSYIQFLNDEVVSKYIVPKIDLNSTDNTIIKSLQSIPFENENIIMDLVKDGQASRQQIEGYFNVKRKFGQYVNMRIIAFDGANIYEPLKIELLGLLDNEMKSICGIKSK